MDLDALDARIAYEKSEIAALAGKMDESEVHLDLARRLAKRIGERDYGLQVENPPALFTDGFELWDSWSEGRDALEIHDHLEALYGWANDD